MIMKVERDELVEELLTEYIKNRVLGTADYGSTRDWTTARRPLGVAVSDPLRPNSPGCGVPIWRKQENKLRQTLAQIEETCGGLPGGTDCTWIS